jgi:hypothetical protein
MDSNSSRLVRVQIHVSNAFSLESRLGDSPQFFRLIGEIVRNRAFGQTQGHKSLQSKTGECWHLSVVIPLANSHASFVRWNALDHECGDFWPRAHWKMPTRPLDTSQTSWPLGHYPTENNQTNTGGSRLARHPQLAGVRKQEAVRADR